MPLGLDPPAAGLPLLPARGYLTAIVLTAIVLGVRLAATPWFGTNVPYLPFYPAILLAAWLGGSGPGLLATALSAIAALYFLSATPGVASSQPAGLAALTTFSATGACIAWSIVQNLLVNAGHAMHGKGRVEVAFTCDGRTCHVTVRDHGPGMSPDILDRVFTPFFTTKARGSGLGLPTARRLIEAHHGEITVSSPADGGTTFHIQLPLQAVVP